MPQYKKQHYLPSAYLKYFSTDQANCSRDSFIWRFDGQKLRPVPIVSQCSGDYFYSKTKPAEAERMFQGVENSYCRCVDKIKSGNTLTGREYGQLLMAMFDLHLRNAVHKNLTGKEGIDAYNLRSRIFMSDILLGRKNIAVTMTEIVNHVGHYWGIQIISITPSHEFATSDHPSAWISLEAAVRQSRPALHMVTLPLTPKFTAVGYDKRVLEVINDQITSNDEQTLNAGQIENAERCIYTSGRMSEDQMAIIQHHFNQKSGTLCEVHETKWKLKLQGLPYQHQFSFIRLRPPLM